MKRAKHSHVRVSRMYWFAVFLAGFIVLPGAGLKVSAFPQSNDQPKTQTPDNVAGPEGGGTSKSVLQSERNVETALKALNASITRNEKGEFTNVAIEDQQLTDFDLAQLGQLNWSKTRSTIRRDKWIQRAPALWLRRNRITDEGLMQLKGLSHLRLLALGGNTGITDAGVKHLIGLQNVERLDLGGTRISDTGLMDLGRLKKLEWLNLAKTKITDAGLVHLKEMKNLKFVSLHSTSITAQGVQVLKGLKLEGLELPSQFVDTGLSYLNGFSHLRRLDLIGTAVTDADLVHLKELTKLEMLFLGDTAITNAGLVHIRHLTNLKELWLNETAVSDAGLKHLKGLANLEWLELSGTDTEELVYLKQLRNLRWLNLSETKITDEELVHLEALTKLEGVKFRGTRVTDRAARKLQHKLPNLRKLMLSDGGRSIKE